MFNLVHCLVSASNSQSRVQTQSKAPPRNFSLILNVNKILLCMFSYLNAYVIVYTGTLLAFIQIHYLSDRIGF